MDKLFAAPDVGPDGSEVGLSHHFGAGTYVRRLCVPRGKVMRMHTHTYDHLSILGAGRGVLITDAGVKPMASGDILEVKAGVRHAFQAEEDSIWLCVHGVDEAEAKVLYGKPK